VDRNGALIPLPDKPIDLTKLRDVMVGVANFFGGADGWLDSFGSAD
jgi:hypothetical protein